jgi:Uma2 family endonuclease
MTSALPVAQDPACYGLLDNGRLMTPDEFDAIPFEDVDDCYHYELVRGVLVVSEMVSPSEADANGELGYLIRRYALQHPRVVIRKTYKAYLHTKTIRRRAVRVVWIGLGRVPKIKEDVPAIAVEFLSPGTKSRKRDYEEKRREYLDLGVQEFWLFDRFRKQLTVFHRRGGTDREQVVPMAETYATPLLPGFELPIGQILKRAEDWDSLISPERPYSEKEKS